MLCVTTRRFVLSRPSYRGYTQQVVDVEKGLQFLQDKGVLAKDPDRDAKLSRLRDPSVLLDPDQRREYEKARERLLRLFSTEETHSDTLPPGLHVWSKSEFPGYDENNVIFLKHPAALSQRYQLSGLCYMHGPVMTQHYALAHNNHSVPMLDLLKFIKVCQITLSKLTGL